MSQFAVVEVLRRLDGAARTGDLVPLCGRPALNRAVESGAVLRLSRGRYALPECPDPWLSAMRLGGVVSHVSAAAHWCLDVVSRPLSPHITVGRNRHDLPPVAAYIHWDNLGAVDLDERAPVTTPLRTTLDCARSLPFGEALAVADSALRSGLVTAQELERAADNLRGAGRQRICRVARHADGRSGSALESGLRAIFIVARISGFDPQTGRAR